MEEKGLRECREGEKGKGSRLPPLLQSYFDHCQRGHPPKHLSGYINVCHTQQCLHQQFHGLWMGQPGRQTLHQAAPGICHFAQLVPIIGILKTDYNPVIS